MKDILAQACELDEEMANMPCFHKGLLATMQVEGAADFKDLEFTINFATAAGGDLIDDSLIDVDDETETDDLKDRVCEALIAKCTIMAEADEARCRSDYCDNDPDCDDCASLMNKNAQAGVVLVKKQNKIIEMKQRKFDRFCNASKAITSPYYHCPAVRPSKLPPPEKAPQNADKTQMKAWREKHKKLSKQLISKRKTTHK